MREGMGSLRPQPSCLVPAPEPSLLGLLRPGPGAVYSCGIFVVLRSSSTAVIFPPPPSPARKDFTVWLIACERRLERLWSKPYTKKSSKRSNGSAGISEIFHRYKRAPKNKKNGGHRPGTTPDPVLQPSAPPYIHLFGKLTYKQYMDKDQILFRWDKADENPGVYAFDVEGDKHNGYYRIKVKIQGVYLVYAQVAVHGREYVNKPNECSHETVCTKPNGERKVLLGSLITQFERRGGTYEEGDDGIGLRALDTKIHMGVFMLQKGDVLSVQIPKNCENMEYSMTPEHSYFGLAKLNQDINKPQKKGKKGR
ncbi:hypothetical protein BsWGS_09239 [Bradybaena similaris]